MFMRRKKGFSLVEMLVVIAIIAVLVSIIIPTVGASQTKANAAANAANLRSVKGQLAVLMVDGQFTHDDATSPTNLLESIEERITEAESEGNVILAEILKGVRFVINAASNILGDTAVGSAINRMNNTYYAQDGALTISGVSYAAPASKTVSVDGLNLRKDTQMTVTFTENDIIVTYDGLTAEVFASIAETGDASSFDMSTVPHAYVDANGNDICDYCNGEYPHSAEDEIYGSIDSGLSGGHQCSNDAHDSHYCSTPDCTNKVGCYDSPTDTDHVCDFPGDCNTPSNVLESCVDVNPKNCVCDICNTTLSHSYGKSGNNDYHICACGATEAHNWINWGLGSTCSVCGENKWNF